MNITLKWSIATYVGITLYVALSNLTWDTTTRKIEAPTMTGQNIPTQNLASLPAVANNRGVVPRHVQTASVTAYSVESHRGWPWRIEDNYGYRYDIFNPATGYMATVAEFPTKSGLNMLHLLINFVGALSVLAVLHLSVSMAARSDFFAQGFTIYLASSCLLWLFVAPLIATTDVALEGALAVPIYLIAIQVVLCYGGPGLLVYWNWRSQCRTARYRHAGEQLT